MNKQLLKELTGNEIKMYMFLTQFATVEVDGSIMLSQIELSEELNINKNTVNKAINSLLDKGLIRREFYIEKNLKHSKYILINFIPKNSIESYSQSFTENKMEGYSDLAQQAIQEFPELAELSEQDIACKLFGKCCRRQANKYNYRELLEQYKYASKLKWE